MAGLEANEEEERPGMPPSPPVGPPPTDALSPKEESLLEGSHASGRVPGISSRSIQSQRQRKMKEPQMSAVGWHSLLGAPGARLSGSVQGLSLSSVWWAHSASVLSSPHSATCTRSSVPPSLVEGHSYRERSVTAETRLQDVLPGSLRLKDTSICPGLPLGGGEECPFLPQRPPSHPPKMMHWFIVKPGSCQHTLPTLDVVHLCHFQINIIISLL